MQSQNAVLMLAELEPDPAVFELQLELYPTFEAW